MESNAVVKERGEKNRKRRGMLPLVLGILLMLFGGALLLTVRGHLAYVLPAPTITQDGNELTELYQAGQEQLQSMADTLDASAMAARWQSASLSSDAQSVQAAVYAMGAGYFDVIHETLQSGRLISESDIKQAADVMVVDERTGITLFAGEDPVGKVVSLNGQDYEVVGVIKGGRRIGEISEQVAYIPVTSASRHALPVQTVELLARSSDTTTATAILMEDTLRAWQDGGSFYHFDKLALGAVMPARWVILFAGVALLLSLLSRLNAAVWARVCYYVDQLKTRYARSMLGGMTASVAVAMLGYALLAGAAFALAKFSISPLYVFTEWVPEVVVEWSSLTSRFWALNDAASSAVRYVTRLNCVEELGRGLFRWGVMAVLLGMSINGIPLFQRRVKMPQINRDM